MLEGNVAVALPNFFFSIVALQIWIYKYVYLLFHI